MLRTTASSSFSRERLSVQHCSSASSAAPSACHGIRAEHAAHVTYGHQHAGCAMEWWLVERTWQSLPPGMIAISEQNKTQARIHTNTHLKLVEYDGVLQWVQSCAPIPPPPPPSHCQHVGQPLYPLLLVVVV